MQLSISAITTPLLSPLLVRRLIGRHALSISQPCGPNVGTNIGLVPAMTFAVDFAMSSAKNFSTKPFSKGHS